MDEPTTFRAGDSAAWRVSLPDYPASAGWVLAYRLLSPAGVSQDISTTADGDDHVIALAASATADWPAGTATLVKIVTKGTERITLGAPTVSILPNLAVIGTFDGRSRNQKTLDDLEAALANYAAAGQGHVAEYLVAGRTVKFRSSQEILDLIAHYRRLVAKDRAALALLFGGQPPGRCYYRG